MEAVKVRVQTQPGFARVWEMDFQSLSDRKVHSGMHNTYLFFFGYTYSYYVIYFLFVVSSHSFFLYYVACTRDWYRFGDGRYHVS
ncbi:hypothetical protein HanRHA438_Chr14g0666311 [Helianthus annuus]|nr:hypothetical protein HanRHA438_Chr14g0666311 [Helianthus annuus]